MSSIQTTVVRRQDVDPPPWTMDCMWVALANPQQQAFTWCTHTLVCYLLKGNATNSQFCKPLISEDMISSTLSFLFLVYFSFKNKLVCYAVVSGQYIDYISVLILFSVFGSDLRLLWILFINARATTFSTYLHDLKPRREENIRQFSHKTGCVVWQQIVDYRKQSTTHRLN